MKKYFLAAFCVALPQSAFAVFPFLVQTNGSADFEVGFGEWDGNGFVQPNVVAGNFNVDGLNSALLIDDFTSGTLSFLTDVDDPQPGGLPRVSSTLSAKVSVSFVGGTGDLYVNNSANFDGGNERFNSLGLRDLGGLTSVSFTISYNQYVAGRNSATGEFQSRPVLSALGLVSAGAGLDINNFNIDMTLNDIRSSSDGTTFSDGIAPGGVTIRSAGLSTGVGGDGTYEASGFAGLVDLGDIANNINFLLVKGMDLNGNGNYEASESNLLYARSQTWTITPAGGATEFDAGTHFTFSVDGQQYSNINLVPEASVSLLTALAGLFVIGYRRRSRV